jgi:hypothetical protein
MEEVTKFGVMAVFMKDTGKMIKLTETVDLFMQMEIIMKVSGRTTRPTDSENILIQMAQNMKAFGLMINSMDRVRKNGQMALNMKETINMGKKMGSVSFYGPTCHLIKEISTIIISMVTENISGLTEENTQATGYATKCMEKDFSLGKMAESIKEIIMTIRSKATVYLLGQMEDNMTDNGIMESKTEWEYTTIQDLKFVTVFGKMERE